VSLGRRAAIDRHHGIRKGREGTDVAIIADGGIKYSGDISKALAAAHRA